jgi:osmotically inducible lipoprotein OsmB
MFTSLTHETLINSPAENPVDEQVTSTTDLMPPMARVIIFGVLLFIIFALSGCSTTSFSKQQVGTATGAVVGGVVGSYVTGGSTAGTVIGAAGGAVVGNQIGKQLDKVK